MDKPSKHAAPAADSSDDDEDDDEMDWEEVHIPVLPQDIEIVLSAAPSGPKGASSARKGISYAERVLRIQCHKLHTLALLGNARVRNRWIDDELLHARLLSLTPLPLQNAFSSIHKSRIPDHNQRGRLFEHAMRNLAEWWSRSFFRVQPHGHIRSLTYEEVQERMVAFGYISPPPPPPPETDSNAEPSNLKVHPPFSSSSSYSAFSKALQNKTPKSKKAAEPSDLFSSSSSSTALQPEEVHLDLEDLQDIVDADGERIKSPKSLMKHALMKTGSRDTSAQLFTALCRALGIPARLVVSLQSVPWRSNVGKKAGRGGAKGKGKGKVKDKSLAGTGDETGTGSAKGKGKVKGGAKKKAVKKKKAVVVDVKGKAKARDDDDDDDDTSTLSLSEDDSPSESSPPPPKSTKAKGKEKAKPIHPSAKSTKAKVKTVVSKSSAAAAAVSSSAAGSDSGSSTTLSQKPGGKKKKKATIPPLTPPSDPLTTPPVFWTEVFSRADGWWFPVDPVRGLVNKRKVFDPSSQPPTATSYAANGLAPGVAFGMGLAPRGSAASTSVSASTSAAGGGKASQSQVIRDNRMLYVLAFEEDGFARDVTRRYARQYNAKIVKAQGGSIGGGRMARRMWWEGVVGCVTRPYRLHRDDVEDEELDKAEMTEAMPATISGFKDHPLYVLPRHLLSTQIIHPTPPATRELGKFRGEPVYPRSAVISLKTAENWLRSEGRSVSAGEQPLKMVKLRAGTLNKMREVEVRRERELAAAAAGDGDEQGRFGVEGDVMQGLYGRHQTEMYKSPPVSNGVIPKNSFGNIDLYVPSMLPEGGVHLPYKGISKIAKKLGFDYAEAVVGFEFKKRKAYPILGGIVTAKDNEEILLEAYWAAEKDAEEKARIKKEERILKHWAKLISALKTRKRIHDEYAKPKNFVISNPSALAGATSNFAATITTTTITTTNVVPSAALTGAGAKTEKGRGKEGSVHEEHFQDITAPTTTTTTTTTNPLAGGGFRAEGADKIVHAYSLPKPQFAIHEVLPSSSLSLAKHRPGNRSHKVYEGQSGKKGVAAAAAGDLALAPARGAEVGPNRYEGVDWHMTYDLEDEEEEKEEHDCRPADNDDDNDDAMRVDQPPSTASSPLSLASLDQQQDANEAAGQGGAADDETPGFQTMQEIAEAEAAEAAASSRAARANNGDGDVVEVIETKGIVAVTTTPGTGRTTRSSRSSTVAAAAAVVSGKSSAHGTATPKGKGNKGGSGGAQPSSVAKTQAAVTPRGAHTHRGGAASRGRGAAARRKTVPAGTKRKRARNHSDDDAENEAEVDGSGSGGDSGDEMVESSPTKKRARRRPGTDDGVALSAARATKVEPAASTRVLRPRRGQGQAG